MERDLSGRDYVYVWVDGIHTGVRLGGDDRLCCLVMVGVQARMARRSWWPSPTATGSRTRVGRCLLRDLKKRGMRAPELAVGDGALGFWGAVGDVFPETRHQRDWVHKTMNVLDVMPKSVHGRAKAAIREITEAENKAHASKAVEDFSEEFGVKWPKAVERITSEEEALLRYYDYPAEHWRHLRTTNPIESPFAAGEGEDRHHQGTGLQARRACDDLQADGGSRGEVEEAKRTSLGGIGKSRSEVRERRVGRGRKRSEEKVAA